MDTSKIRDYILKENHYLVISTGQDKYYGFKVARKQEMILTYNFATETQNNQGPMVPYGSTSVPPGYQNYYVEINKLPLTKIQNIYDLFKIDKTNVIYQVFFGIAPSYLRVGMRLNTTSIVSLEQSISPTTSFIDLFTIDGFTSPYDQPAPDSEFYAIQPLTIGMTLMNPVTIPVNPRLQFFINRMVVEPIPKNIQNAIMTNAIPTRKVSLGNATESVGGFDRFSEYLIAGGV